MSARREQFWAAALALLTCAGLAALQGYGHSRRTIGPIEGPLAAPSAEKVLVDKPEEAYRFWKARGMRGRLLVDAAGHWDRVFVESFEPYLTSATFPSRFFNLSTWWERELNGTNFLFLAAQNGIAREMVCLLPADAYRQMFDPPEHGGAVAAGPVSIKSYEGFRRVYLADPADHPLDEPVLLYVGASYLEELTPEAAAGMLGRGGWTMDLVVFCLEEGDERVSAEAREKLALLASNMGARRLGWNP